MLRAGKEIVVIDKNGEAFSPADWLNSGTFSSFGQVNCAISDNRTRQYDLANPKQRQKYFISTWGGELSLVTDPEAYL